MKVLRKLQDYLPSVRRADELLACQSAKTVLIVVDQKYYTHSGGPGLTYLERGKLPPGCQEAMDVTIPFEEVAVMLLERLGLEVVESSTDHHDVVLRIRATGTGDEFIPDGKTLVYIGASIAGQISLEIAGKKPVSTCRFSGSDARAKNIVPGGYAWVEGSPCTEALFMATFIGARSFPRGLLKMLDEVFGSSPLITVLLEDTDRAFHIMRHRTWEGMNRKMSKRLQIFEKRLSG